MSAVPELPPMLIESLCSGDDAVFFPGMRTEYKVVTR